MNEFVIKNKHHFTIWNHLDFKENTEIFDDLSSMLTKLNE